MKLRTVFAAVTLGITALACTGGEAVDTQNDKLSSPWKEMNLPVGDGEILVNGSDVLLIGWETYDGGLSALDASWTSAVEARDESCLSCHKGGGQVLWHDSVHREEELSCDGCHQLHTVNDPMLDKSTEAEACFACHPRQRAESRLPSRHPILEDDVVVYSWASILGRITIGAGSVIGGNVWVTRDVAPGSLVTQASVRQTGFAGGDGI